MNVALHIPKNMILCLITLYMTKKLKLKTMFVLHYRRLIQIPLNVRRHKNTECVLAHRVVFFFMG